MPVSYANLESGPLVLTLDVVPSMSKLIKVSWDITQVFCFITPSFTFNMYFTLYQIADNHYATGLCLKMCIRSKLIWVYIEDLT